METENFDSHLAEFDNSDEHLLDEPIPEDIVAEEDDDYQVRMILRTFHPWMD